MSFQAVWVGKLLLTLTASIGFLSRVCSDVLVEIILADKDRGTHGAFVRLLPCVAEYVILQGVCFEEASATLVAAEGLFNFRMATFHVGSQLRDAAIRSLTLCTLMWFFTFVHQNVCLQGFFSEVHATVLTLCILPPFMLFHMISQSSCSQAFETTLFALQAIVFEV